MTLSPCHCATTARGLDRHALRGVGPVVALHDDLGARHRRVGVALHDRVVRHRVAAGDDVLVLAVVGEPVVHQRRTGLHRRDEVRDDRQGLVLDLDQASRLGGDLLGEGGDASDDLALEANDVLREQVAVLDEASEPHVGEVGLGHDRDDPGERPRPRGVDLQDLRVGVVGVAELGVGHAGEAEVGRVPAGPGDLLLAVLPYEPQGRLDRRHARPPSVRTRILSGTGPAPQPEPRDRLVPGVGRAEMATEQRHRVDLDLDVEQASHRAPPRGSGRAASRERR